MSATCIVVPGTLDTFRVLAGGMAHVGWIRLSRGKQMRWIARDLGRVQRAAAERSFVEKRTAIAWLLEAA